MPLSPEERAQLAAVMTAVIGPLLENIREGLAAGRLPMRAKIHVRRMFGPEPGHASVEHDEESVLDFGSMFVPLIDATAHVPAFGQLLALLEQSPFERVVVDAAEEPVSGDMRSHWLRQFVIVPFLRFYLELRPSAEWDNDAFAEIFDDLVRHAEGEPVPVHILAPLGSFTSELERVDFEEGLAIVTLTDKAASDLYDSFGQAAWGPANVTLQSLLEWSHAIEYRGMGPSPRQGDIESPPTPEVLTALRLLRESTVHTAFTWQRPDGRIFRPPGGHLSHGSDGVSGFRLFGQLVLEAEDVDALRVLFRRLRDTKHQDSDAERRFELAIRRLNISATRRMVEDRLLDYWVALETLFAHDGRAEILYRARTRVARYIGDDLEDRRNIATTLSRSYDRRSKVVHGDRPRADLQQLTTETGEILRRALRQMLEAGTPPDVEALDLY